MSVRPLLAVIVAGALIAASMPAIEMAQRTQADHDLSLAVESIESATERMVRHSDPVQMGVPGAKRRVQVSLPAQPAGSKLSIGPANSSDQTGNTVILTSVPGSPRKRTILNVSVRGLEDEDTVDWSDSLTIRESAELTLRYRRVDGTPVITVARGFK